jgi:hypothetical protein
MASETEPLDVPTIGKKVLYFISSTAATPDVEEFRSGDYLLGPEEISEEAISRTTRVVPASTFALSREPCRTAMIRAFREMYKTVSLPSIR